MRQPIHTFDFTQDSGESSFGCVSGRTEKEALSRLKQRYKLTASELATAAPRTKRKETK